MTDNDVFARFTDRARRVMVLAQEECRLADRSEVGTESLLLGLIHEGEGVAALALAQCKVDLESVRGRVELIVSPTGAPAGQGIRFTPRAKKVLELAFQEALQLGHNYVGTEHILLGLIREGAGVGATALVNLGIDLGYLRRTVVELLSGYKTMEAAEEAEASESPALEPSELLTDIEKRALDLTGELAGLFGEIVGPESSRHADLTEIVSAIHILQRYVLAQAGCRAYPGEYRLLGETR